MPVTIYDVAKRAKVGIGTVSRVINDSPQISPKTKQKVLKVIKELKYQPHAVAQSLARKKTHLIACIVPFFTGYFFVEILRGIQREISDHSYDMVLYSVDKFEKIDFFLQRTLREKKVDGVLLLSMDISNYLAEKFISAKIPIVLVDSFHPLLDSIVSENEQGAYLATKHLMDCGHQKIAIITGQLNSAPANIRLKGFTKALELNNRQLNEKFVISVSSDTDPEIKINHGFNKDAGYQLMMKLLTVNGEKPSAVFISSDIQAIGAMKAIDEMGLKVPDDISVIGFDDIEMAELVGLSTMKQPMYQMGKLAVNRLIERINDNTLPAFYKAFTPELIIRKSCKKVINN